MEHYYTKNPKSKLRVKKIEIEGLEFFTPSGVFSYGKVDVGSFVLVSNIDLKSNSKVLDLGCGWGFIGIYLKKKFSGLEVFMSDINERACEFAKKNAKLNKVEVEIIQSDLFENIKEKFDCILLNPPQSAGKKLCLMMIEKSKEFLKKGGKLEIVARHKKGGKSLSEFMEKVFGNLEIVVRKKGFTVYRSYFR